MTVITKDIYNYLTSGISIYLKPIGFKFRKGKSDFYKKTINGAWSIGLDVKKASDNLHLTMHLVCKIRLDEIESVYSKYHPYISEIELKNNITFSVVYGNRPTFKKSISEPFFPADVSSKINQFKDIFKSEIQPFFEEYSCRKKLKLNLTSKDIDVRIISNQIVRCSILLSEAALEKDLNLFNMYADELLKFCDKPYGKAQLPTAKSIIDGIKNEYF